jgi:hypothetical protein
MELAETLIRDRLKAELKNAVNHLQDALPIGAEMWDYLGVTKENLKK